MQLKQCVYHKKDSYWERLTTYSKKKRCTNLTFAHLLYIVFYF